MGETSFKLMLLIFNVIFIAFISAIIIFIWQYRIKKKKHNKQLEKIDILHKKELLKTQMEIQSETMKHIGREIHDNIGQKLTLSSIYLQQLVYENKTLEFTETINTINEVINESLVDLRHLSKSLTDDTVEDNTLKQLIELECKRIDKLKMFDITFHSTLTQKIHSYQTKSILLRITQEFLQNSIKHSKGDTITVHLFNDHHSLILDLKDNGQGFDVENVTSNGIGLKNIKKRIGLLKGSLHIKSDKKGTQLTATIPV